ncbi:MAG: helix-turn-helix transcriptional regulator [Faecalibacterium sp.]
MMELFFCCEGRGTGQIDSSGFPLHPGDLWVLCAPHGAGTILLHPGGHGIFLQIDPAKTPPCLSSILAGVEVVPSLLYERFCFAASPCVLHTGTALGQLFCAGCAAAEPSRLGCWRVQTLELLLYLSGQTFEPPQLPCTARQELAEQVAEYLHENMECSFSLEQLCAQFRVSGTVLKESIRRVYGLPLGQFARMQKMRSAAVLLQSTSLSVTEIAGRVGYDNPSKFSGAFRKVMGLTPREYRTANGSQKLSMSNWS